MVYPLSCTRVGVSLLMYPGWCILPYIPGLVYPAVHTRVVVMLHIPGWWSCCTYPGGVGCVLSVHSGPVSERVNAGNALIPDPVLLARVPEVYPDFQHFYAHLYTFGKKSPGL